MISRQYRSFHILTLLFISLMILGWGGFVVVEDRVVASQESPAPVVLPIQSTFLAYQPTGDYLPMQIQPTYDFDEDDSFQKYLGNGQLLNNNEYVPEDLVPIDSNFTANASKRFSLRQEAATQFADMAWYFWNHFNAKLMISSAYRSSTFQQSLLKKGCSRARCAQVGSSEHQLWLAIDLGVITKGGKYIALNKGNLYYQWLIEHASDWWFHNSYQKGIEVDGQMAEWRHRRYMGEDLAKELQDKQITFSEYMKDQSSQQVVKTTNTL